MKVRNDNYRMLILQLDHRILATATLASITGLWWSTRKLDLHPAIRSLIGSTVGMAVLQVFTFRESTLDLAVSTDLHHDRFIFGKKFKIAESETGKLSGTC